uniref:long-chain-fatty-acid--CoA ligase n=1 Tax=Cacopsylla melanoneura TaxID=428564 RepID=A0A8D8VB01_9HEMI
MDLNKILHSKGAMLALFLSVTFLFLDSKFLLLSIGLTWFLYIHKELVHMLIVTFPRDYTCIKAFLTYKLILGYYQFKGWTVVDIFQTQVKKYANKPALRHEDQTMTFQEIEDHSNKIANFFKAKGLQRGDAVGLIMEGRPEYVCTWLGLTKIGVVTAFINTNQRQHILIHSIKVVDCKAIVYGAELSEALTEIEDNVRDIPLYVSGTHNRPQAKVLPSSVRLDDELPNVSTDSPSKDIKNNKPKDKLAFIYTSGTTGLPKAAVMTHVRAMFMAISARYQTSMTSDDVIYTTLPLYHTAGGLLGIGQCLLGGSTVIIRSKFSASNFWKDCIKYNCTVAQYIGEMCRYLLAVPEKPEDTKHSVKTMIGNGLRPQVWEPFVKRFGIERICEFYGATEGNANLMNADGKVGAVGYIPYIAIPFYPVGLIRCDPETSEPIRKDNGLCIPCKEDEPGILIGMIKESRAESHFNGYADEKASEKKIIRNVYSHGDAAFNTGDILIKDKLQYYYFKDRTGDTFRWRGENVATSEVEDALSKIVQLKDAAVYGVEIPNVEGKAGMAAIVDIENTLDLKQLISGMQKTLPSYARPLFIRTIKEVEMTGTFKLKKIDLQTEGFNPNKVKDPLYFMDPSTNEYIPLTTDIYQKIVDGKVRL